MTRGRFTAFSLTVVAVAAALALGLPPARRWGEERLRRALEERGSALLGGTLRIAGVRIEFLPPGIKLESLQAERQGNRGSQAIVSTDEVSVQASILTLLGVRRGPLLVKAKRPHIVLHLAEGRAFSFGEGSGPQSPQALALIPAGSTLDIKEGRLEVDLAGGPAFDLGGLDVEATPGPQGTVRGVARFSSGSGTWRGREWPGLNGEVTFAGNAESMRLDPLVVRGEGVSLAGRTTLSGADAGIEGSLDIGMDVGKLARFYPEGASPGGQLKASLSGNVRDGVPAASGSLEVENFALWGLSIGTLRSDLTLDRSVHLKGIRAHLLGGEMTGASEVRFSGDRVDAETEVRLDGVDAAQVLEYAGWTGPPVTGTIHYSGKNRFDSSGLLSMRGSGVVDAVGHYRSTHGENLPLEVTVDLAVDGESVRLQNGTLRAGSTRASFSGRAARGEGLSLKMSGGTGNLSDILPLFAPPRKKPPAGTLKDQPQDPRSTRPSTGASLRPAPGRLAFAKLMRSVEGPPPALFATLSLQRILPQRSAIGAGRLAASPARPKAPRARAADEESPLERMVRSLGGRWEWDGDLSYGTHGLNFSGKLAGSDLTYRGTPIGSLQARIVYRNDALAIEEATLEPEKDASALLSGRIEFRGEGSLKLEGRLESFPLAPVLAVLGMKAPLEGRLSGHILLSGHPNAPTGRATIEISPVRVAGLEFDALRGELIFTPDLVEMRPAIFTQGAGQISLEGRIPYQVAGWVPEEGGSLPGLQVQGTGVDLSTWSKAAGGPLEGIVSIEGSIEGALAEPHGALSLSARSVRVHGLSLGDLTARVDLQGETAQVSLQAPDGGVAITGTVGIGAGKEADLRVLLTDFKLPGGVILNGPSEDVQVVLGGEVRIEGKPEDPASLRARAVLQRFEATAAGVTVTPDAPIELSLESGKMLLAPAVLTGRGTRIEIRGECDPGPGTIDLAASGRFDLNLLRLFLKNLQATGEGTIVLHVGGALASPKYEGRLVVEAGAIRHPDLPFPIADFLGKAEFEEEHLKIQSLEFLAGGGPVQGSGEIQFGDLRRSESPFTVRAAEVRFRGTDVKAEFPSGFRSVSDMDLLVRRSGAVTSLSGSIDLVRGVYLKDFKLDSPLGRSRVSEVFQPPAGGAFTDIDLDLVIRASQDVWLRNDFGKLEGQGELQVRGTTDRPSFAGRITAVEGGTIRFRNVEYRVLGGTMDFTDPDRINPVFDLEAEAHVGEYQISLHFEGTVDDFHYDLSSNPPLPEQDIVALLITGRTLGSVGTETSGLAEETLTSALSGLTGEWTGRVAGHGGIDVLSIDPLQVNAQGNPTTRITIGKQVTPDLFVAYSSDVGSTEGTIYQLDYALDRDFHFTSLRDSDGSIGGDFRYILRGKPPSLPGVIDPAAAAPTIGKLTLEGDLHFKESRIRRRLRAKEGKPRNRSTLNDGVDRVLSFYHNRGYYMADVDYHETRVSARVVDLTLHAQAGPKVKIEIDGTRGKPGIRQDIVPFWEKGLFLEEIVEQAREHIESMFKDRGFLRVKVEAEVLQRDPDRFRVRYQVHQGPKAQATEVRFEGVRRIEEEEIRQAISTKPDTLFSRGLVKDATLHVDAAIIRMLYLSHGYPEVSVSDPEVKLDESGEHAIVTFRLQEGPHVTLGRPRFEGNSTFTSAELETAAAFPENGPYTAAGMDAAVLRLRRRYDDSGYPDARIKCRPPEIESGIDAAVVAPVFEISEGAHQRVGDIRISGNLITRDEVVRKALTVMPGTSLSRGDLQASQTRLYGRGIFRSVAVVPEPAPKSTGGPPAASAPVPEGSGPEGAPPSGIRTTDVQVTVREMAPLTQVYGIGYDNEEKLRGLYEISNRNIFGGGRYIGLQVRASQLQKRGALSYREKGIFGGRYDLLASTFAEDESSPSFEGRTTGASIQVSRRFTRATRTLYSYTLQDVNPSDTSPDIEESTVRLSSIGVSAIHDTRDAPFDPTRGHFLSGEVQYFGSGIGSEADFVKMYAQIYKFKRVFPNLIWAQALRAGATVPFAQSTTGPALTCTEGPVTDSGVPITERFFVGGDTTVRGFERDTVGDKCNGDPLGGEGLFILNEELRFPIHNLFGGVLFYDGGNVYRVLDEYKVTDLRHVIGAGLRLATPIGPFRLEYGAILDREPDEPRGQFFFSIGQAF